VWRTLWAGGTRLSCRFEVLAYACRSEEFSAALDEIVDDEETRCLLLRRIVFRACVCRPDARISGIKEAKATRMNAGAYPRGEQPRSGHRNV